METCDRSLVLTEAFLEEEGLNKPRTLTWLEENGWYFDCEVLRNKEDVLEGS